jgi:hypothetical protein
VQAKAYRSLATSHLVCAGWTVVSAERDTVDFNTARRYDRPETSKTTVELPAPTM